MRSVGSITVRQVGVFRGWNWGRIAKKRKVEIWISQPLCSKGDFEKKTYGRTRPAGIKYFRLLCTWQRSRLGLGLLGRIRRVRKISTNPEDVRLSVRFLFHWRVFLYDFLFPVCPSKLFFLKLLLPSVNKPFRSKIQLGKVAQYLRGGGGFFFFFFFFGPGRRHPLDLTCLDLLINRDTRTEVYSLGHSGMRYYSFISFAWLPLTFQKQRRCVNPISSLLESHSPPWSQAWIAISILLSPTIPCQKKVAHPARRVLGCIRRSLVFSIPCTATVNVSHFQVVSSFRAHMHRWNKSAVILNKSTSKMPLAYLPRISIMMVASHIGTYTTITTKVHCWMWHLIRTMITIVLPIRLTSLFRPAINLG